ncbi:SusC/RagA family TonB-linked outer membrane protein [Chryseobacterium sp. BIGb0232]|uniref:SusC/RagA family TonB-linked outer membrane protein n=1 Tax=Chryseobacterium sp. BIGb0232 TaxID=2940598 RepID=UPI000F474209|nr:SusC/RagA family TonB-linked outer membrane protein [Chryseobacterium sp. BIGb0232]MCS4303364.1 TonB-linked SusC/RagA family outer membrane protein [Chryseobacterium sp. BIGb0232]ROS11365.1 TonB-linked SusC/RagA family outer membrane protein [Chryseobacterium nakagawai]
MKKLTTSVLIIALSASFINVNAQKKGNDTLNTQNIGEIVVTGALGIKKKQDAITGSTALVKTEELTKAGNPNAVQALTGKVSGLYINVPNSSVNGQATINLRGQRSLTGDNGALIVIDGAPSTAAIFQQLPPDVIESVNVYKGQQGSALYGERGANGVIVVTTRKGTKSEKIQFTLTSNIDASSVYKMPIIQDKYGQGGPGGDFTPGLPEMGGTTWIPYENTSWGPLYSDPIIAGKNLIIGTPDANGQFVMGKYAPRKNHFADFFKTGILYQNGLTMNVGGSDAYAFFSFNRTQNDFVVDKDRLNRNNILFKAGKKLGKLRVDGTFNLVDQQTSETNSNLYDDLIQMPSNVDIRAFSKPDAEHYFTTYADNPYWTIDNERYNNKSTTFSGILNLEYTFNDHISLSYLGNVLSISALGESYNNGWRFGKVFAPTGTAYDDKSFLDFNHTNIESSYYKSVSRRFNYYGDIMLNFNYKLTDDLGLKLNIGNNVRDDSFTVATVGGTNLQIPGFYHINNVGNPSPFSELQNTQTRIRSIAGFANLDLAYRDFLFLNSTFRIEKSSVLSTRDTFTQELKNKPYSYYSVGLSFVPTKAFEILKGGVMNYAKITASYTKVGSTAAIGAYATDEVTGLIPSGFPMNNASYVINRNPTNPDIKPEFTNTKEASIQLGFFEDRITLGGSVFTSGVTDLITNSSISNAAGITTLRDNIGDATNKGLELDLGLTPIRTNDFEWNIRGSYSTYKSEVTDLKNGVDDILLLQVGRPSAGIYVKKGEEYPLIKGTKYQRDDQGRIIVGKNGVPLATSGFEVLGKVTPDYILGFSTSFRYKGFRLSGTADYRTGNSFISITKQLLGFTGALEKSADYDRSQGYVVPNSVQNVGTAANPVYVTNTTAALGADYNGAITYFTANGYYSSVGEEFVVDGTAFKIREIALSYTLPKSILANTFLNNLTFGVYARNPFAWYAKSNRNFADPETASNTGAVNQRPGQALGTGGPNAYGVAYTGQYPTTRTFGVSMSASF